MAILQRILATKPSTASSGQTHLYYYICDTQAELPPSSLVVGELAIALDTLKVYIADTTTTWKEVAKTGSSGYVPVGTLGSGTANSSTYLRGDGAWSTVTATVNLGQIVMLDTGSAMP